MLGCSCKASGDESVDGTAESGDNSGISVEIKTCYQSLSDLLLEQLETTLSAESGE